MISVKYGLLCEMVQVLDTGGFNIIQTFDRISFSASTPPPFRIVRMCFVAQVEGSVFDGSEHTLTLRLMDEDHRPLVDPVQLECLLTTRGRGRPLGTRLVASWNNTRVPRFGTYVLELREGNRVLWTELFHVTPSEAATSMTQG